MQLVLADTSVFVDFLRERRPNNQVFRELLAANLVLLSPFVKLELLAGAKKAERKNLSDLLGSLSIVEVSMKLFEAAETLMPYQRGQGFNVGLIDYLIILQALSVSAPLLTHDKVMAKLARALGVDLVV